MRLGGRYRRPLNVSRTWAVIGLDLIVITCDSSVRFDMAILGEQFFAGEVW